MDFIYLIGWIIYSLVEGIREGYYFDSNPKLPKYNIHALFSIHRLIVLMIAWQHWTVSVSFIFIFPFFHDGAYYFTRNILNKNIYKKGFWDSPSPTSTALLDFTLTERIFLLIAGGSFWILYIIFLHKLI
jgi:hypothetical protein